MQNIWTITRREYSHYFSSPVAYVIAFIILLVVGGVFAASLFLTLQSMGQMPPPTVQVVLAPLMFVLIFACPALTMRLLSEEQRLGTLELLLTAPVRDFELVVGKWLGSFLFILTIVIITLAYPLVLNQMVDPGIDQGLLISGYLGVILVSGAFLAIGVASSSLFSNQVASFLMTLGIIILLFWVVGIAAQVANPGASSIFTYLDVSNHFYDSLLAGKVTLGDISYLLSLIALSLFLGTVSVETRRWR